jgi:hypothetical protein
MEKGWGLMAIRSGRGEESTTLGWIGRGHQDAADFPAAS